MGATLLHVYTRDSTLGRGWSLLQLVPGAPLLAETDRRYDVWQAASPILYGRLSVRWSRLALVVGWVVVLAISIRHPLRSEAWSHRRGDTWKLD